MYKQVDRKAIRAKKHYRILKHISGTAECPRLALAERAKAKGIEECIFDRGGLVYHGRVAALADGAREGGLNF